MIMTERIKLTLLSLFNIVFLLTFTYVFMDTLVNPSRSFYEMNAIVIVILSMTLFAFLYGAYYLMNRLSAKKLIIWSGVNFTLLFILQIIFLVNFQVQPTWDIGSVYDAALNQKDYFSYLSGYFTIKYPNNIPLFFLDLIGMRFLSLLGIENYYFYFSIFNAFMVSVSMGCFYLFLKRRLGLVAATWGSLLMLFITPLYTYTTIVYTDTLVMIFPILSVLLYDIFYHSKRKSRYIILVLMSMTLTVGIIIKTNAIILMVAIIIHFIITKRIKTYFTFLIGLLVPFLLINQLYQAVLSPYYPDGKENLGYPATNWIMMGLHGNGNYHWEDADFTYDLKVNQGLTNEEVKQVHLSVIKQRLSDYGVNGFIKHLQEKINFTWADGTYYAPEKLSRSPIEVNQVQSYIFGEERGDFVYSCQGVHLVVLLLILAGAVKLFKQKNAFESVLSITIFGTFLFLLIWETRSRYLILYLPLMMLLSVYGMVAIKNLKIND